MRLETAKYLDVHLKSNLNWTDHIKTTTNKASSVGAFLQWNIRPCLRETKTLCFFALVRPILEYACTVWDPHTQDNIHRLEMVQLRNARFVTGHYHHTSSIAPMLQHLKWPSLRERRAWFKMVMVYGTVNLHSEFLKIYLLSVLTSNHGHTQQFQIQFTRTP